MLFEKELIARFAYPAVQLALRFAGHEAMGWFRKQADHY